MKLEIVPQIWSFSRSRGLGQKLNGLNESHARKKQFASIRFKRSKSVIYWFDFSAQKVDNRDRDIPIIK